MAHRTSSKSRSPRNSPRNVSGRDAQLTACPPSVGLRNWKKDVQPEAAQKSSASQQLPAKRSRDKVPPPQRVRILQRYATGDSIVKIAREEGRNRETVSRIVHSDEMQVYVARMREKFYGLADLAIAAVQHALEKRKDAQLGYRILVDTGVVLNPAQRAEIQASQPLGTEEARHKELMAQLMEVAFERHHVYGTPIQELDPHLKAIGAKINPDTGKLEPIGAVGKTGKVVN